MADLTKRLRQQADENACDGYPEWAATMRAAADEIEQLQKECLHSSRDAVKRAGIMAAAEWAMYGINVDGDHHLIQVAKTLFADLVELTARAERLEEALRHVQQHLEDVAMARGGHGVFAGTHRIVTQALGAPQGGRGDG